MRDQRDMMIDAQAKHITRLNAESLELKKQIAELRVEVAQAKAASNHYLTIQRAIIENPTLMTAWRQFIVTARLACSEPVEGLTKSSAPKEAAESFNYYYSNLPKSC